MDSVGLLTKKKPYKNCQKHLESLLTPRPGLLRVPYRYGISKEHGVLMANTTPSDFFASSTSLWACHSGLLGMMRMINKPERSNSI